MYTPSLTLTDILIVCTIKNLFLVFFIKKQNKIDSKKILSFINVAYQQYLYQISDILEVNSSRSSRTEVEFLLLFYFV